jgi:AcrR family transcriptional regulator
MQHAAGGRRPVNEAALTPIVSAARACFARNGVQRTRMEDVATAAGVSRQAVYRYVSSRQDLVELAILARCEEFAEELIAATDFGASDVVESMTDLMFKMITLGREDEEFAELAAAMPRVQLNLLLSSAASPMHAMVSRCFEPLFERAWKQGLLRDDLSRREMVEWLQGILTLLAPRVDLDERDTRRYLREFAIRSLLR